MIVTEDEAKTKRCQESFGPPALEGGSMIAVAGTSISVGSGPLHCIGSACMAWWWADKQTSDGQERGYCGKARP